MFTEEKEKDFTIEYKVMNSLVRALTTNVFGYVYHFETSDKIWDVLKSICEENTLVGKNSLPEADEEISR